MICLKVTAMHHDTLQRGEFCMWLSSNGEGLLVVYFFKVNVVHVLVKKLKMWMKWSRTPHVNLLNTVPDIESHKPCPYVTCRSNTYNVHHWTFLKNHMKTLLPRQSTNKGNALIILIDFKCNDLILFHLKYTIHFRYFFFK